MFSLTRDGVAGLACLAGSLFLLWLSRGLPQSALVPIGPAFYPRILFGITAVLAALLIVSDLWRRPRAAAAGSAQYRLVVLAFAIFAGYVILMPLLGYRVATLMFVGVLQVVIEPPRGRRWLLVAAVAVGTMLGTYYVFEGYLSVLLPRGRLTGF
ncbi:MAG TPA: tripartite tricarboxylate transporter TctB family protein [Methylomirabilota bacterium]|nr:tripartite tricarboxylate transporter TctB family protein [Methylomirabilota bacterium]